jgi:Suppressor of fused protein (SUFU)
MVDEHPRFYVCEVAPGPRSMLWLYVSVGTSQLRRKAPLEFILACPKQTERGVELVTMAARFHKTHGLGVAHTLPIGEPWLPGSACDHFLVSVPYPWGPGLENVDHDGVHAHILWLVPITAAERAYGSQNGVESLEVLFESRKLEYWNVQRPSLVEHDG